jgi:hypothetical protein
VSRSFGSHLLVEVSSDAVTCHMASNGLWTTEIKKLLDSSGMQLGSYVFKARSRVTEVSARRADMTLQFSSIV